MHVFILTGASRGLGLAMASALLRPGHHLLAIARHPAAGLTTVARAGGATLEQWAADLVDPLPTASRLRAWLASWPGAQGGSPPESVTLINNAALLAEPAPLAQSEPATLSAATRVSLEAPLVLTAAFLGATASWPGPRRVLNISSGLGRWAMAGSASYCAAKAGLDHFTRAVALEEAQRPNGARLVSLAPGVVATDMQVQLRSADPARFSERARFVALHEQGALDTPDAAAAKVLAFLARPDFGSQPVADVRDP
jgi:NAD(P)-dependent dehydrogenase (short-subunit alcohol dehydrogenase family)